MVGRTIRQAISSDFVRRDLRAAIIPWVVARALVGAALGAARYLVDQRHLTDIVQAPQGLFSWDASFYRVIAEGGYDLLPRSGLRFFPFYPLVGRGVGEALAGHTALGLLVVASGSALVGGALLHRLVLRETSDSRLAGRAAWYVAVIPAGMAYVLAYAESIVLVCAIGSFLALRSRHWCSAAMFGVVAGMTRPVGLLLAIPAMVEAARNLRASGVRERIERAAAVLSAPIGTAIYLGWVGARYGDPFLPSRVQDRPNLRGGTVDPITHVADAIRHVLDGDRFGSGLHLLWIAVAIALLVAIGRSLPASYTAYAGAALALALMAKNPGSFERYVFTTFPFVVGIAVVTRRREADRVVASVAAAGLAGYAALAFLGEFVP